MKIAYKGFDKDLQCKGTQFKVGEVYSKLLSGKPRLCSSDGFHYCDKLKDVFEHYSNDSGNRFCEIEVMGEFTSDKKKGITNSFRIIRELSKDEILDVSYKTALRLDIVQMLQSKYPMLHIGGSVGLFLHGIKLKRMIYNTTHPDLDMMSPYFILLEGDDTLKITESTSLPSSNDFGDTYICDNFTKIDVRTDPLQKYEIIEHEGFKYKVSPLEVIMAAKIKYASQGNIKHKHDVYDICGKAVKESNNAVDLMF